MNQISTTGSLILTCLCLALPACKTNSSDVQTDIRPDSDEQPSPLGYSARIAERRDADIKRIEATNGNDIYNNLRPLHEDRLEKVQNSDLERELKSIVLNYIHADPKAMGIEATRPSTHRMRELNQRTIAQIEEDIEHLDREKKVRLARFFADLASWYIEQHRAASSSADKAWHLRSFDLFNGIGEHLPNVGPADYGWIE